MDIGIIGAGNVGGTLGRLLAARGHAITFGVRDPGRVDAAAFGATVRATSVPDAVRDAAVVIVATPWGATQAALADAGDLTGKVLVDSTNPFGPPLPDGVASGGEAVARWAAGARVVKAFNSFGYNVLPQPRFGDGQATGFYCGDDAAAKETVRGLVEDLGFAPLDCGPLGAARYLEMLCVFWIGLSRDYGREIAFQLLRRDER